MAALDKITGMPALPVTSAFRESIPAAPKGYMGPKEYAPAEQELTSELTKATQRVGEADVEIEKAKREEKARELESKATGLQKFAQDVEQMPEKQALKELREQQRGMEFIPTKDTAQDIASLFSLIGVIGMVVGRGNAQQAMGAMNGMLEGHRKGRADLFKQQAAEFDKNFKAMQTKVSTALSEYQEALERKKTDKEAGELMAQAALARTESPLLKAMKDKQGDVAVVETLKQMLKSTTETAPKIINDLQTKRDEREFRKQEAEANRQLRRELAEMKTSGAGGLPKDAKTNDEHRFRYTAMENVKDVLNDLQNPEIRKLIGPQNQYLPDIILNLQDKYPQLAQKLARFQSQEFQIGGKNLTKTEQGILGPIYNWRGLTAKALEDNLTEADRAMNREQMILEARYPGLQEVSERYLKTGAAPSAPTAPAATSAVERGTDEKGSFHYEYNQDRSKRRKVYD